MVFIKDNKAKIYNILFWVTNLLFITYFLIWVSVNWDNQKVLYDYNVKMFPWICRLICVQLLSFRLKKVSFYDFGFWFVAISYAFMFGYVFRDIFSLESRLLWNPIVNFGNSELFHAYVFVLLSLELFSFGYLIVYKSTYTLKKDKLYNIAPDERLYSIGVILFLIGGIARLINDLRIISVTQSANSYSAYSQAARSGLIDDLAYLMLPGVFFIFFSGCIKQRAKKMIFVIVLAYLVCVMMLTGSRKIHIFSILSLFLGYEFSSKERHLSIRRAIIYAFIAIIILNVVITIRDYRNDLASIGPILIEKLLSFNIFENILEEVLAETGLTLLSVSAIIKVVPNVMPYQYGLTYLRTIPSFLPIGWLVGDFFDLASSTYVINSYTGIPVGSSFIGDLYWNWGYFGGGFVAFLFGILICKFFLHINNKSNTREACAIYFSIFAQLIVLVRSELIDVYRPVIMIFIIVFIVKKFNINIRMIKK